MAILAECDICGAQHRVKEALAGGSIRCRDCGVQIKVLKENVITAEAFVEDGGQLRRREPEPRIGFWPWLVAVLVSGVVVLALILVIWACSLLMRSR